MKNLLIAFATLAVAGSAFAADGMNWKHEGEVRIRYLDAMNLTAVKTSDAKVQSNANEWYNRTKIGFTGTQGEDFTAHVVLLNANTWGANSGVSTAASTENLVTLHEGNFWWKANDMFSMKFGRSLVSFGDGTVMGANDWDAVPQTFDGGTFNFDFGFASAKAFGLKVKEISTGAAGGLTYDKEENIYGLVFDFKNLPDFLKMANVFYLKDQTDVQAATNGADYARYGLTLKGDMQNVDYKVTYATQNGSSRDFSLDKNNDVKKAASMIDFAAGYSMPEMMKARFGVVYHTDSGNKSDDPKKNDTYEGFYNEKHCVAGCMDIMTWGNLTYFGANFKFMPADKTTVIVNYFNYSRSSDKVAYNGAATITGQDGTTANTKKALGSSVDLIGVHQYTDSFQMLARYSFFTAGEYFTTGTGGAKINRDNYSQIGLQAKLTF